jgi:hypothetical protein
MDEPVKIEQEPAGPITATNTMKISTVAIVVAVLALVGVVGVAFALKTNREVTFPTPYQAVLLANGAVYYAKVQGYGTPNPVLIDVFYIVTQTNPETKQTSNVLVKRGKELHGPDRMYVNPNQIVFVEPVGPGSKVAQLIAESH